MKIKIDKVCATCGSNDVRADAYASWNVETQTWELEQTFEKGAYCENCDGETRIKDKEIGGHNVDE